MANPLRRLPSVGRVLQEPAAAALAGRAGHAVATAAVRAALETARAGLLEAPDDPGAGDLAAAVAAAAAAGERPHLQPVLNATGVILHTGLGRAPLADEAIEAIEATGRGYVNLELDLASGGRGSRQDALEPLLCELTGAEAALAVGNNAAALVLAVAALAHGREVIVSRGQLVEIGDGFRIGEILAAAGCRLVEVGATNRTVLADYERAIGAQTGLLLRVHPSNFRVVGFAHEVGIADLAGLGERVGVPVLDDLGSGLLRADPLLAGEPALVDAIAAGATLACCSGDKLLGGPQAGILVGRRDAVTACRRHPLARAVRIGKLATAALEATLRLHRDPAHARLRVPVLRMAHEHLASIRARADRLAAELGGELVETEARVGGGSLPTLALPSFGCALDDPQGTLAAALRRGRPALLGRLVDGRLVLDARTLDDGAAGLAAIAVRAARGG